MWEKHLFTACEMGIYQSWHSSCCRYSHTLTQVLHTAPPGFYRSLEWTSPVANACYSHSNYQRRLKLTKILINVSRHVILTYSNS